MNSDMKSFLRQGLLQYCEAQHTLAVFEGEMEKHLGAAVHNRTRWSPLKKVRIKTPSAGGGSGEYGWWVSEFVFS